MAAYVSDESVVSYISSKSRSESESQKKEFSKIPHPSRQFRHFCLRPVVLGAFGIEFERQDAIKRRGAHARINVKVLS